MMSMILTDSEVMNQSDDDLLAALEHADRPTKQRIAHLLRMSMHDELRYSSSTTPLLDGIKHASEKLFELEHAESELVWQAQMQDGYNEAFV